MKFNLNKDYYFRLEFYPWEMTPEEESLYGFPVILNLGKMKWNDARKEKRRWLKVLDPAKCGLDLVRVRSDSENVDSGNSDSVSCNHRGGYDK